MKPSEKEVRRALKLYTSEDGQLHDGENPQVGKSGNGMLYLVLSHYMLRDLGMYGAQDAVEFSEAVGRCKVGDFFTRGLFTRFRGHKGQDSQDNYIGIVAGLDLWRSILNEVNVQLKEMYAYGEKNNWCFNTVSPGKFSWGGWFGRYPAFTAQLDYALHGETSWWKDVYLEYALMNPKKEGQDGYFLNYLIAQTLPPYKDGLKAEVNKQILDKWGSMGAMFEDYFQNPNHPLAKYWR